MNAFTRCELRISRLGFQPNFNFENTDLCMAVSSDISCTLKSVFKSGGSWFGFCSRGTVYFLPSRKYYVQVE